MLVVFSASSSQGSLGTRNYSLLRLRGMVIYNLQMSAHMHTLTHKLLHISKVAKPKQCTKTAGNHIITQHFLPAETLLTGPVRNCQR